MALFSSTTCLIAGSFKGTTQPKIAALLTSNGATITKQVNDPALTHLIASEREYDKGAKTTAVLERRKAGETIHIIPLSWVEDSIEQGKKLEEKEYDYEMNAEQEEDGAEEEEEEDVKPSKGKGKATTTKSNDKGKKRARSPTPTPPPAVPAPAPKMVKVEQKGACPVDHLFPHKDSTHVLFAADGVPYDAMLNQTDLGKNANKYFILQVLQHDKTPNTFYTFFRWGRVGENGQQATKESSSAGGAVALFEKKFKDKTTHSWSSRTNPPKAGKYTYLERHYGSDEDDDDAAPSDSEDAPSARIAGPSSAKKPKKESSTPPPAPISALPTETQSLLSMIFSLSSLSSTLTSFEYDARKLPLGKLAKSTLEAGYTALREIADILNDDSNTGSVARDSQGMPRGEALMMLSNRYYTTVPHAFGRNRPPVIGDKVRLKHELDLVDALGDLKITQELINSAKLNATAGLHPLDAQYQSLGVQQLAPIPPSSSTFSTLQSLLSRTKGSTHYHTLHLLSAFQVSREADDARFDAFSKSLVGGGTRRLLWHGSRSSNYGGILSEGCRLAPPEAPSSGWMFGKGFYLASMSTKSAQYCYHQISNNEGLLMLVEAQLGPKPFYTRQQAEYEADVSSKKAGFLSTWGVGRTQPAGWQDASILDPSLKGVQMPTIEKDPVEANTTSALLYDEFIVYNTAQVRIRYLLRVRFDAVEDDYY